MSDCSLLDEDVGVGWFVFVACLFFLLLALVFVALVFGGMEVCFLKKKNYDAEPILIFHFLKFYVEKYLFLKCN